MSDKVRVYALKNRGRHRYAVIGDDEEAAERTGGLGSSVTKLGVLAALWTFILAPVACTGTRVEAWIEAWMAWLPPGLGTLVVLGWFTLAMCGPTISAAICESYVDRPR